MPAIQTFTSPVADILFTQDFPVISEPGSLASGNLPKYTPVKRDANGDWVIATELDTAQGILLEAVDASGSAQPCVVWTSGCFNIDLVAWDADLTSDALKRASLSDTLFTRALNAI